MDRMVNSKFLIVLGIVLLSAGLVFTSCSSGGGGGGGTQGGQSQLTLSGTAASGKPIAGAALILKDSLGQSLSATTAANGTYSLDTTGLTPPFLIQIASGGSTTLYSVSADANPQTVNVTPLTDVIVRSWYGVQNVSVDTAFNAPASNPAPAPASVSVISTLVQNTMQLWLNQAGVTAGTFNLISTPFTANGTGVDLVLDQTTVNPSTGSLVISDGTITQTSTLTVTPATGSIGVATTTTGPNGTSSSTNTTVVPVQTAQQTALDAISTSLNNFAAVVNAKGTALTVADVQQYFDPGLLNDGLSKDQFVQQAVASLAGRTISFTVLSINNLDTANNVADVVFLLSQSQGGQTETETSEFFFKQVGGTWLLSGNQRIASVDVVAEMRTNQGAFSGDNGPDINVDVQPPQGTVSGVTISGGGIWTSATLTQSGIVSDPSGTLDHYYINSGPLLSNLPPAGSPFTVTLALASGGSVSYTLPINSWTDEAISITSPTGSTLADANLGSSLLVNWTLPTTFPIARVKLSVLTFTGDQNNPATIQCDTDGPILGITATSATVTVPTTCSGLPVLQVNLNLSVDGVNGEREEVIYQFQ
jgi:hypothetical protein